MILRLVRSRGAARRCAAVLQIVVCLLQNDDTLEGGHGGATGESGKDAAQELQDRGGKVILDNVTAHRLWKNNSN